MAKQPGEEAPVTYDRCVPIHVVVNDRTAPPDASSLVDEAIAEVETATGLVVVMEGPTSEPPSKERPARADRYGDRWAPVLLSWSDENETPDLSGETAGIGGSSRFERNGHQWFTTGGVTLDGPQLRKLLQTRLGRDSARAVIMHELGHLVGLNHVDSSTELMRPKGSSDLTTWGPGDRAGLAALGSGECVDY